MKKCFKLSRQKGQGIKRAKEFEGHLQFAKQSNNGAAVFKNLIISVNQEFYIQPTIPVSSVKTIEKYFKYKNL